MSRESDATILIVDNDPDLRRVISLRLSRAGYSCVEAGTGAQALSEWRRRSFDVVVSDLNMPSGDGIALADALQRGEAATQPRGGTGDRRVRPHEFADLVGRHLGGAAIVEQRHVPLRGLWHGQVGGCLHHVAGHALGEHQPL